jgi:hypothetical protein
LVIPAPLSVASPGKGSGAFHCYRVYLDPLFAFYNVCLWHLPERRKNREKYHSTYPSLLEAELDNMGLE